MADTLLQVDGLTIHYVTAQETVYAVDGISFSLKRGETLGIVGETGAGKTTTALSLMQLLPERTARVVGGRALFDGQDILSMSGSQIRAIRGNRIAMVFQDPMTSLNPVMTIGDQIFEALSFHTPRDKARRDLNQRVDEVLALVGIPPDRRNDYPHQFSGGMKQRVVIAVALSCEPELLIADEPTTALDVTIQAQVLQMIRDLRDRLGTAMIMITHDLGIVAQTCDQVAVMYAGEIIEFGTAADLFISTAHHPYTHGLFGSIPNLKLSSRRLHPIAGLMPDPTIVFPGCKFAARCPRRMPVCDTARPGMYASGTHQIKCYLFADGFQEDGAHDEG